MIISCLYPQKIHIEDEKTKEQVEKTFGVKVNIEEWFECPKTYENVSYHENEKNEDNFINNYQKDINFNKNNDELLNFCEKNTKNISFYENKEFENSKILNDNKKIIYIVKPTDTYQSVAKKLGVSVQTLKSIAKTKHLFIGQKIDIQKG